MQASGPVCVDLSDFSLDVSLSEWASSVLKDFDCLAEVLDSLLIGFFAELVVTLFLQSCNFVLDLAHFWGTFSGCWCLFWCLFR